MSFAYVGAFENRQYEQKLIEVQMLIYFHQPRL